MNNILEFLQNLKTIKLPDKLAIFFIFICIFVNLANVFLFNIFIKSKPSGRKTVLGKYTNSILLLSRVV